MEKSWIRIQISTLKPVQYRKKEKMSELQNSSNKSNDWGVIAGEPNKSTEIFKLGCLLADAI
jgi:hypothetical protein